MTLSVDTLPDDPAALKALLLEQNNTINGLRQQLGTLIEALRLERHRHYGTRSEKNPGQQELFDEADNVENVVDEQSESTTDQKQSPTRRNRSGRQPLPADLPRVTVVHELGPDERQCACGCQLEEIGEVVSEQIDIIPAQVRVTRTVRKKYACKGCEESIKTAQAPAVLLPKAIASANTMAYIITAKYADGLPLYRLSDILKRHKIDLPRQTLSESVLKVAHKLEPLVEHLLEQLKSGPLIHMDETRVQVLHEPGKSPQSNSYMWVQRGGPPDKPIVHFTYDPGRSTAVADRLLNGFDGVLMSDGYAPYRQVAAAKQLVHLCCWSHARRRFVEAQKAQPKGRSGRADRAIAFIAKLYAVETRCKDSDAATRHRTRQSQSVATLQAFKSWLEELQQKITPKNALGKAVNYTLKYWPELSRYVENGTWPIDNNVAENAIRPFVIGRKAWLFSNSQRGATASANLYGLIETAKANSREPYQYLCWLLNEIPHTAVEDIHTLAPWNMPVISPV